MKYSYTGIDIQNYLISFLLASKCFNPVLLLVLDSRFLLYLELIHKTDNSFGFIMNLENPLVAFPGLTYHVPGTRLCKYASSKKYIYIFLIFRNCDANAKNRANYFLFEKTRADLQLMKWAQTRYVNAHTEENAQNTILMLESFPGKFIQMTVCERTAAIACKWTLSTTSFKANVAKRKKCLKLILENCAIPTEHNNPQSYTLCMLLSYSFINSNCSNDPHLALFNKAYAKSIFLRLVSLTESIWPKIG